MLDTFRYLRSDNMELALVEQGRNTSYAELARQVECLASSLLGTLTDLHEERVALYVPSSNAYVVTLLGIWRAGGIAVPLNVLATPLELEHYLHSAGVSRLICLDGLSDALDQLCRELEIEVLPYAGLLETTSRALPRITPDRRALMLFTSGTTSKPKGVISTHGSLHAQIKSLCEAWEWSATDCIPLFLPLHHIHGIVNVLCCALASGARIWLFPRFDAARVLSAANEGRFSLFMAVPTVYLKIIDIMQGQSEPERKASCQAFAAMRLNVSGSAACPVPLFNQWRELTGQVLLERYGMTEIGMALSNPYRGERRAGSVGLPLPGVEVRLYNEKDQPVPGEGTPGEIRVRGDNLFLEYWNNPGATAESFRDGWFCTGDVAVLEQGYYRIMGRSSIDIIKSGGYKLSALEIEGVLLEHPAIVECAVIGVDDPTWGERVIACVVLKSSSQLAYDDFKSWCEDRLSPYKIPKQLDVLDALPRNAMGKVTKPDLKKKFSP